MATRSNTKTKNRDESDILDIFKDVLCSDVFKKIICEVVHQEISTLQETIKELRTEIADLRTVNQQLISNITNNKVISDPNVVPESKNPISSENNWSIVRNKSQKPYVRSAENTAMNEIRNVQQKKANTAIHNNDNNHQLIASPDSLSWCLDSSCPLKVINKPVGGRNNAWISDDIIRQKSITSVITDNSRFKRISFASTVIFENQAMSEKYVVSVIQCVRVDEPLEETIKRQEDLIGN
nr:unnamed protein product [Callosobruchus analis]